MNVPSPNTLGSMAALIRNSAEFGYSTPNIKKNEDFTQHRLINTTVSAVRI